MPALSPTMEAGNVAKWHVKEGQAYAEGDCIADIETDKATLPLEMQEEGYLAKVLQPEGAKDVAVGQPLAVLVDAEEAVTAFRDYRAESAGQGLAESASEAPSEARAAEDGPGTTAPGAADGADFPSHHVLEMPALSPTMEQGNLVEWKVSVGQRVAEGDVLAEIETDKATLGFDSQEEGFVAKLLVAAGAKDIPVGKPVVVLAEDEGSVPAFQGFVAGDSKPAQKDESAPPSKDAPSSYSGPRSSRLGPAARMLLLEHGLSSSDVAPTGPGGIVTKGDVLAAVSTGRQAGHAPEPAHQQEQARKAETPSMQRHAPDRGQDAVPVAAATDVPTASGRARRGGERYRDVPLTQMRRIIARRLLESKQTIPCIYVRRSASLEALTRARAALKEAGAKVSVNDFVVKAVGKALRAVPAACAGWDAKAEAPVAFDGADVSVAVATDKGLITPIVKAADSRSLSEISATVRELAGRAKENKLKPEEFTGGSFSISNLGMYGIRDFIAIINPPQAGILAVGGTQHRTVIGADGQLRMEPFMTVTLSADNRVIDDETAAHFLDSFRTHIENPILLS